MFLNFFFLNEEICFSCGSATLAELNKLTPRLLGLGHVKGRELGGIVEPSLFVKREITKAPH